MRLFHSWADDLPPDERALHRRLGGLCLWDEMPKPLRVVVVVLGTIYFGGGLIVPFFWSF